MARETDTHAESPTIHVAVDVGGTFTDVCVFDSASGDIRIAKSPSTPDAIGGVLAGLREAEVDLEKVALFAHGTTVATNALITRNFPRTCMVTTKGFRDIIEIRRGTRDELWDVYKEVAPPYIRRRDRLVVSERIDAAGRVIEALDEDEARRVAAVLRRRGVAGVAVCFINAYANPENEHRMKEILEEELPDVYVSTSSDVLPEIFEHERFSTTTANAVLAPVVAGYIHELDAELKTGGYDGGLLVLHSGGGVMTPGAVEKLAARVASSGIAAGAIAVREIAKVAGFDNAIGLDMGGTSTDISLVDRGELRVTRDWSVEYGYPILFPSIEVLTIGAGGGSLSWIDAGGSMRNGPQSAGSVPGPACYGRGNEQATNTDANLVLGRLGDQLVGGAMKLDRKAAERAVIQTIGEPLGLDLDDAANAIIRIANANMADAVRLISIGRGYDPRDFALFAFGGAGALHGASVAQELAIPQVLVPPNPGITSALGCLFVDVRHDLTKMFLAGVDSVDVAELNGEFRQLEERARDLLTAEGIDEDKIDLQRAIDMRYAGQWRSITVPVAEEASLDDALTWFYAEYEREHAYRSAGADVEIYQLHLTAIGATPKAALPTAQTSSGRPEPVATRRVMFDDGAVEERTPIYDRAGLGAGAELTGPAIIEQLDATTVVPPDVSVHVDDWNNLIMQVGKDARDA